MTNENGHNINGEWATLTLPDSGAVLEYRRVSHMFLSDVHRSVKAPEPPLQEISYGEKKVLEPNPAHPDYALALKDYNRALSERILETAVLVGVRVEVDTERVKEIREATEGMDTRLPVNDKVLYVTRVLCETGEDLRTLRDAIIRKSQPTEEAVSEALKRFPAETPGSRPLPAESAA